MKCFYAYIECDTDAFMCKECTLYIQITNAEDK